MASPDGGIDLRSDTVTVPTDAMRAAMAGADVGDDGYGEDPTVNRLQDLAAGLLGKEAALFVPSGTMANQIAFRVLARPGTDVVCSARAHVRRYEAGAVSMNAGVQLRPLADDDGQMNTADLVDAFADVPHHFPDISLVTLENTHMPANGWPVYPAEVEAVVDVARAHGVPVHCDGARIFNAAIACAVTAADLARPVDTIMFCLSKGLSAPVGSVLCGTADLIASAVVERKRLGGAMRQAGVIAAAGIVALQTMIDRLADDHARAQRLAGALADRFPGAVDPNRVRSNVVCCAREALPPDLLERLSAQGIRAGTIDAETIRFMTHKDIDDTDLARVIDAFDHEGG